MILWWEREHSSRMIEKKVIFLIIITMIKQLKYNVHFMCVCVYVENAVIARSIEIICSPGCACVHVGKVYWINVFIVGRRKEDKKLTLLTYMCMRVCIYVRDRKDGPFVFSSPHVRYLWTLVTMCHVTVVGKKRRMFLRSVSCVRCSAVHRPCLW